MSFVLSFQLGTVIAPFIVDLGGEANPNLPPAVFGAMMITLSITLLFTPETKGMPLIQNFRDMRRCSDTSIAAKLHQAIFKRGINS